MRHCPDWLMRNELVFKGWMCDELTHKPVFLLVPLPVVTAYNKVSQTEVIFISSVTRLCSDILGMFGHYVLHMILLHHVLQMICSHVWFNSSGCVQRERGIRMSHSSCSVPVLHLPVSACWEILRYNTLSCSVKSSDSSSQSRTGFLRHGSQITSESVIVWSSSLPGSPVPSYAVRDGGSDSVFTLFLPCEALCASFYCMKSAI